MRNFLTDLWTFYPFVTIVAALATFLCCSSSGATFKWCFMNSILWSQIAFTAAFCTRSLSSRWEEIELGSGPRTFFFSNQKKKNLYGHSLWPGLLAWMPGSLAWMTLPMSYELCMSYPLVMLWMYMCCNLWCSYRINCMSCAFSETWSDEAVFYSPPADILVRIQSCPAQIKVNEVCASWRFV